MPEIPELVYIEKYLNRHVAARVLTAVDVSKPVVIRTVMDQTIDRVLPQRRICGIARNGPFLRFEFDGSMDVILNLMLAGTIQHQSPAGRAAGHRCVTFLLDDGSRLNFCDSRLMMKLYVVPHDGVSAIPGYGRQGIDVLGPGFTGERFAVLAAKHRRKQVRVFLRDHSAMSAIGNAYADEILFDAQIHPKTFVGTLTDDQLETLFTSIRTVLQSGIEAVEKARQPIQQRVRGHLRVRNRKGEPCPRCGTKIRREGVRGHDAFFCPACQPATRRLFLDWRKIQEAGRRT